MRDGARLLLLTTTGARSGAPHTVPLAYLPDGGHEFLVIGSAGGSPRHPAWFHNLVANPQVTVEDGVFVTDALAIVLEGADRERAFARAVESDPGWAEYEERSGRVLPVVALRSVPGPPRFAGGTVVSGGAAPQKAPSRRRGRCALPAARRAAGRPGAGARAPARRAQRIAALVAQLQDVLDDHEEPALLRREVDRLTDQLEQHLSYEEEQLVPALDAVLR